jgi:hypothetical protein
MAGHNEACRESYLCSGEAVSRRPASPRSASLAPPFLPVEEIHNAPVSSARATTYRVGQRRHSATGSCELWCVCNSDGGASSEPLWDSLSASEGTWKVVLFWTLKRGHQHGRASVQTIERRLEHIARLIPRIFDCATLVEPRIEIAGNYDSCAVYQEPRRDLTRLIRIHHDQKIRAPYRSWRERPRAMSR